jgi:hypothetical protein
MPIIDPNEFSAWFENMNEYAIRDEDGIVVGIKDDTPFHIRESYKGFYAVYDALELGLIP